MEFYFDKIHPRLEPIVLLIALLGIVLRLLNLMGSELFLVVGLSLLSVLALLEVFKPFFIRQGLMRVIYYLMCVVRAVCQMAILFSIMNYRGAEQMIVQGSVFGFVVLLLYYLQPDKSAISNRTFEKTLGAVAIALIIYFGQR